MRKVWKVRYVLTILIIGIVATSLATPVAAEEKKEEIKVAYITAAYVTQGTYETSHYNAFREMIEKYGFSGMTVEKVAYGDTPEVVRGLVATGAKMIVTLDAGEASGFFQVCDEYPDVWFVVMSALASLEGHKNVASFSPNFKEAAYLVGVVGGLLTKTSKNAVVSGERIPPIDVDIRRGWTAGARSVDPDMELEILWTGSWVDESLAREATFSLIDWGADVIMPAIPAERGVYTAAEEKGISTIGYFADAYDVSETCVTSWVFKSSVAYDTLGKTFLDGTLEAKIYDVNVAGGYITLAPSRGRLPAEIEYRLAQVAKDIKAGKISVDDEIEKLFKD